MTTAPHNVRPSALAGLWYPAHPQALHDTITSMLADADPTAINGKLVGLLAPHAGLRYSGPVAAHAFKLLETLRPQIIAILCPYHQPPYNAYGYPVATTTHTAYTTPLGTVPVNHDVLDVLADRIPLKAIPRDDEHALEIELPFLQVVLTEPFTILPLMLLDQSAEASHRLGLALADILRNRDALLIASSDLSHFYPQGQANQLDHQTLNAIRRYTPEKLFESGQGEGACGRGAVAAVMWAAQALGADSADILHYATSGDTSGDFSRVVGYAAGAFYARQ